jgi:hypothetical protein
MSRGQSTFRQRDLTAAVKGAKAAGCEIFRVSVDREGRIVVETSQPPGDDVAGKPNPWDEVLK